MGDLNDGSVCCGANELLIQVQESVDALLERKQLVVSRVPDMQILAFECQRPRFARHDVVVAWAGLRQERLRDEAFVIRILFEQLGDRVDAVLSLILEEEVRKALAFDSVVNRQGRMRTYD